MKERILNNNCDFNNYNFVMFMTASGNTGSICLLLGNKFVKIVYCSLTTFSTKSVIISPEKYRETKKSCRTH